MLLLNRVCAGMTWFSMVPLLPLLFMRNAFCNGVPEFIAALAGLGASGAIGWHISTICIHDRNSILIGIGPAAFWTVLFWPK